MGERALDWQLPKPARSAGPLPTVFLRKGVGSAEVGALTTWKQRKCCKAAGTRINGDQNKPLLVLVLIVEILIRVFRQSPASFLLRVRGCATGHAAIEKHLNFHTTISRAPLSRGVVSYKLCLTIAHGRDETAQGNFMIHGQVLDH